MSVRLHIERLVVDAGLGAVGTDAHLLKEAIAAELTGLLAEGTGWASSDAWRVDSPDLVRPTFGGAEVLGAELAGAIYRSVRP